MSEPHKHRWHLGKLNDMAGQFRVSVWVCECNTMKRHVFPIDSEILVYDPDNLQPHTGQTPERLVKEMP